MRKFSSRLWIIALVVAWGFDLLFWQKIPGISFTIFTALCVLGGLILAWGEGLRPAVASLPILLPWAFFAAMSFIRQEPFTLSLNYLLTLMLMAILAHTLLGGRWIFYGVADYVVGLFQLAGSVLSKGLLQGVQSRTPAENGVSATPNRPSFWKRSLPVIRGLLLAIPVLGVFAVLLASADPIFSKRLTDVFSFLRIEKLPEYVWRFSYIMILAYLLVGVYLHSLTRSREEKLLSQDKPLLAPFLGLTESAIILGGLDLLFAFSSPSSSVISSEATPISRSRGIPTPNMPGAALESCWQWLFLACSCSWVWAISPAVKSLSSAGSSPGWGSPW